MFEESCLEYLSVCTVFTLRSLDSTIWSGRKFGQKDLKQVQMFQLVNRARWFERNFSRRSNLLTRYRNKLLGLYGKPWGGSLYPPRPIAQKVQKLLSKHPTLIGGWLVVDLILKRNSKSSLVACVLSHCLSIPHLPFQCCAVVEILTDQPLVW